MDELLERINAIELPDLFGFFGTTWTAQENTLVGPEAPVWCWMLTLGGDSEYVVLRVSTHVWPSDIRVDATAADLLELANYLQKVEEITYEWVIEQQLTKDWTVGATLRHVDETASDNDIVINDRIHADRAAYWADGWRLHV